MIKIAVNSMYMYINCRSGVTVNLYSPKNYSPVLIFGEISTPQYIFPG